jgi:3-hydroxymyristoyl/3-hydroxydecanoyl-(acyl carrier protein) dehydratase
MSETGVRLSYQDLEEYLPHRGINILPDELIISEDGNCGTTHTRVAEGDPRGRRIFGRDDGKGNWVWIEAFLGELMALTGVPLLAKELAQEGKVSVFSKISNVSMSKLIPMNAEITGKTTITRRRSDFTVFSCQAYLGDEQVLDSEVLSGAAPLGLIAASPVQTLTQQGGELIARPDWKDPSMYFADRVLKSDQSAGTLLASYVYPLEHPLVPGHFPDAALMMGVTQWAAIADAAWEARRRFGIQSAISVDGRIYRPDGSDIVNVRDLQLEPCAKDLPRIRSTNRIAFRDPIRPGDGVFIEVSIKSC